MTRKTNRSLPPISDAEWIVMRAIWERGPLTANQVVEALEKRTHWKPKTIQTLLSRLARKRALTFQKQGREYLFRPLVSAADCERAVTQSFLGRFFGGELAPFLSRFVEHQALSPEEVRELKRILERRKS
jgi:BlaI family penicillinase repressor